MHHPLPSQSNNRALIALAAGTVLLALACVGYLAARSSMFTGKLTTPLDPAPPVVQVDPPPQPEQTPKKELPSVIVAPVTPPVAVKKVPVKGSPLIAGAMDTHPVAATSTKGRDALAAAALIDWHIEKKLDLAGIAPSPISSDAEFLRRVCLDLTGQIPTTQRTLAFLNSTDPARRSKLIDELLASEQFGTNFAYYWRDLFAKRDGEYLYVPNEPVFLAWMTRQYNQHAQWDKIVHALLTAHGDEGTHGDAYLFLTNQDMNQPAPDKLAGTVTTLFMGTQLQCAECHVHPVYKQWNPKDFWGIAAFFAHTRTERILDAKGKGGQGTAKITDDVLVKGKGDPKSKAIAANPPGLVPIPDPTNPDKLIGVARARYFGGDAAPTMDRSKYRPALADWFASAKNSYFAPAHVNRMWAYFFASGFVNPIDDMRPDNAGSHPELLRALADEFTVSDHDVKHLMRAICNSKTYQRTSRPLPENGDDGVLFSHQKVRVMTPKMLFDSLAIATGRDLATGGAGKGGGKKEGPKATGKAAVLQAFDTRDYDESNAEFTYGIPQLLRLMNRQLGTVCDDLAKKVAADSKSQEQAIEKLYLMVLSRRPTARETERMLAFVAREGDPVRGYAGALWALLNSAEFVCNR